MQSWRLEWLQSWYIDALSFDPYDASACSKFGRRTHHTASTLHPLLPLDTDRISATLPQVNLEDCSDCLSKGSEVLEGLSQWLLGLDSGQSISLHAQISGSSFPQEIWRMEPVGCLVRIAWTRFAGQLQLQLGWQIHSLDKKPCSLELQKVCFPSPPRHASASVHISSTSDDCRSAPRTLRVGAKSTLHKYLLLNLPLKVRADTLLPEPQL